MYRAGCWFEATHWLATKEPHVTHPWPGPAVRAVLPSGRPMPYAHSKADARERLARAEQAVGKRLWRVLLAVLIDGLTFREAAKPVAREILPPKVAQDIRSLERLGGALLRLALLELSEHLAAVK